MKTKKWLALTLSLMVASLSSSALAQDAPPVPADSAPKPKSPTKSPRRSTSKSPAKTGAKSAKKHNPAPTDGKILSAGPAVVKEKNVNVRGQAAINSEIVTHLKRGDHVQVLEVFEKRAKADEPSKWAKIALPSSAPVWINASFLDAGLAVVPKKLNLRSGPGENFSVVGRITKGTAVKEVERKGDWVRVEPPADSYAFVAAHLIANESAPFVASTEPSRPAAAVTTPPATATLPPATSPTPVATATQPPAAETPVASAKPPVVGSEPAGTTPPLVATTVASPPAPADAAVLRPAAPTPVIAPPPPKFEPEEEDIKRVVTREGFVKRSVSIQAPTYFVLENLSNGKTINYLFSTNLVLKDLEGKRVIVTGEEMLDERWPNVPVITIDKLETVR